MGEPQWKDPIVEEIRCVRKKLDKELERDPKGFMKRIHEKALKAGMKIAELKPVPPAGHPKRNSA
ncbi:MAG: hypothetical protein HY537_15395 [Deltaproteobacteria bacterium]|nr:hypothetical protein [Deltaproteobacteria bacterium]